MFVQVLQHACCQITWCSCSIEPRLMRIALMPSVVSESTDWPIKNRRLTCTCIAQEGNKQQLSKSTPPSAAYTHSVHQYINMLKALKQKQWSAGRRCPQYRESSIPSTIISSRTGAPGTGYMILIVRKRCTLLFLSFSTPLTTLYPTQKHLLL